MAWVGSFWEKYIWDVSDVYVTLPMEITDKLYALLETADPLRVQHITDLVSGRLPYIDVLEPQVYGGITRLTRRHDTIRHQQFTSESFAVPTNVVTTGDGGGHGDLWYIVNRRTMESFRAYQKLWLKYTKRHKVSRRHE
jgi:hypothetical protein